MTRTEAIATERTRAYAVAAAVIHVSRQAFVAAWPCVMPLLGDDDAEARAIMHSIETGLLKVEGVLRRGAR